MADITITECIARIRKLPEEVADRAVEIMREEVPHVTGELAKSVRKGKYADGTYYVETAKYVGGGIYGIREVGAIIRAGRKALRPRYGDWLVWKDPHSNSWVKTKYSQPALPNADKNGGKDFVERTKDRVENELQSIWNSL